jgi:hypothetical protein
MKNRFLFYLFRTVAAIVLIRLVGKEVAIAQSFSIVDQPTAQNVDYGKMPPSM